MVDINITPTLAQPPISPQSLELQQAYAKALLDQSMSGQQIGHPLQGVAEMVKALVGGTIARRAGQQQMAAQQAAMGQTSDIMSNLLYGGGSGAPAVSDAAATPSAPAGGVTPTPPAGGDMFGAGVAGLPSAQPAMGAPPISQEKFRAFMTNPWIPAEQKQQVLALWGKNMPDYDYQVVGENVVRTNKRGGPVESVYTAPTKPSADYGDYLKAQSQGYKGSFEDWQVEMKSAGRTQVSIDQKAETAEASERGKALVDHFKTLAEDLPAADQLSQGVDQLDVLLQGVDTGSTAALRNFIQQNTGIALGEGADKLQSISSLVDYMAPRMRVPGSGSSSDRDVAMFKSSLPSLINSPDGNKLILRTIRSMAEHRIAVAQLSEDYLTGQIDGKSALAKMRDLPDPMAEFKTTGLTSAPAAAPAVSAPAAPQAGPTPGMVQEGRGGIKYQFKGGDPKDRNNWAPITPPAAPAAPAAPSPLGAYSLPKLGTLPGEVRSPAVMGAMAPPQAYVTPDQIMNAKPMRAGVL